MSGMMGASGWSIETNDTRCHQCEGGLYLMLRLPPELARWPAGSLGEGTNRLVPLCPWCHGDEPLAQGLLAFFAVHPSVDDANVTEFVSLVNEWLLNLPIPEAFDAKAFELDVAAWHRGDFDESETLGRRRDDPSRRSQPEG
ncbi:DUF6300 family protein [Plantactinospora sp. CA-290183]|uniref:DUF6300 family protein n=1 Tax=Plantactinospora sp. CA-290183 TaxID=3240006 RepID=UPI003D908080